jgi:hypothetical protein
MIRFASPTAARRQRVSQAGHNRVYVRTVSLG